jgi:putative transposase
VIEHGNNEVNLKRQCKLLDVPRSSMYYEPKSTIKDDADILNEIRDIYHETPFYGYRRITVELRKRGLVVNHKRVQRLMLAAGIQAIYPGKRTSVKNASHKVYPYLLKDLKIERPNQVWQVDITYIKLRKGFVYLVCLLDVFSRKIMGSAVSISLDTKVCMEALQAALEHAFPEIINSDQGCQFTSHEWVSCLENFGIKISMDGKGRWVDNVHIERLWRSVKYESVYLHSFETVAQACVALCQYIAFYNTRRPHQVLNYHTPDDVYNLSAIPTKQQLFQQFALSSRQHKLGVAMF